MDSNTFQSGDRVFHPVYGLGVVKGMQARDQAKSGANDYRVDLSEGATLSVPVARAQALGLRPVVNGVAVILTCLRSEARPLPEEDHHRAAELKTRSQAPRPAALPQTVRDLLHHGRAHRLTPADKSWLSKACERLITEAAWVDSIDLEQARYLIQQEVDRFTMQTHLPASSKKRGTIR